METIYYAWVISASILLIITGAIGIRTGPNRKVYAILLDHRKDGYRVSLSRFQMFLWTIIVLSLLSGIAYVRLVEGVENPLNIRIPTQLLMLMGISIGSTAVSTAIKSTKDNNPNIDIIKGAPKIGDIIHIEEIPKGSSRISNTISIEKYQNFWFTLIIAAAYVLAVVAYIDSNSQLIKVNSLPQLDETWNTLLAISHAGYLAGKVPTKT